MVTILCASKKGNWSFPGIDVWDLERDAYFYYGSNKIAAFPPCQQWGKLRAFANPNPDEKELAHFCLKWVLRNGGILEHPEGSIFFRELGLPKICVDMFWFGYPARKKTWLFFHKVKPLSFPLRFDCVQKKVANMSYKSREIFPPTFNAWIINCLTA